VRERLQVTPAQGLQREPLELSMPEPVKQGLLPVVDYPEQPEPLRQSPMV
jgi:hypothetical protein